MLIETYGDNVLTQNACVPSFRQSKSSDSQLKDKDHPGLPKTFRDAELQTMQRLLLIVLPFSR